METLEREIKLQRLYKKSKLNEIHLAKDGKGKEVIVKKITKGKTSPNLISNEIRAGELIKHPNVAKLYSHFEDEQYHYLVMEHVQGMDLFELLEKHQFKPIREKHAKNIFRQLIKAVLFMHKRKVVHRDLKLENIIIMPNMKKVKIIDFGLCEIGKDCQATSTQWSGSPDYVAPEILSHVPYTLCKADVWSLGVCLFAMLFAELPFSLEERVNASLNNDPHPTLVFPENLKEPICEDAKDLIKKMLAVDPDERPLLQDVIHHPWLKSTVVMPSFCSEKNS